MSTDNSYNSTVENIMDSLIGLSLVGIFLSFGLGDIGAFLFGISIEGPLVPEVLVVISALTACALYYGKIRVLQ